MKEVKDCKIVQDLLPSYIDGLTNEDTNQYIGEHLEECEECKKELENMKKELKSEVTKKDSKEVKYIKKFNNKMKILKTVLLVVLLIFILSVSRRMVIIASLNNKINEYTTSTNYYIKASNSYGDSLIITETYKKDNKYVKRIKFLSETSNKVVYTDYYNGETINGYYQTGFEEGNISTKIVRENSFDTISQPVIPSKVEIENPIKFVVMSIFSSITSEKCNEKDCYKVVITEGAIYYIDKETGLTLRTIGEARAGKNAEELYDVITDYQYKFDVVTDDDFIEPDISEYDKVE